MTPILLLAEARGEREAIHDSTLIGPAGVELLRMLHEAETLKLSPVDRALIDLYYRTENSKHLIRLWANHPEVHRTNVFNIHPPANNLGYFLGAKAQAIPGYPMLKVTLKKGAKPEGNFVRREFAPELERLGDEIIQHNPNLIVCLGNVALWALSGASGISKIRGTTLNSTHCVSGYKLLPTYHPSAVLHNWKIRPAVIADLMKAGRESKFPEIRRPHREIWIEPTLIDIAEFFRLHVHPGLPLSVDIETTDTRITCIGFSPAPGLALVVPFDDPRDPRGSYWKSSSDERRCWQLVRRVLEDPAVPKIFQNGAYDITFIWRSMNIKTYGAIEDTMLIHHSLHPESLKGLGFLGSIYSDEASWKDMRHAVTTKRDD